MKKQKAAHGMDGLNKFIEVCKENDVKSILEIGCGEKQEHANILRNKDFIVDTCDFFEDCTYPEGYGEMFNNPIYDAIYLCHVLEHQLNVFDFLSNINHDLKEGGILGITVPPLKHRIVSGHVSVWNAGLIIYNLVLAGFNCNENIHIKQYGYNISVILKKKSIEEFPKLNYDRGDLETLKEYFPKNIKYGLANSFNGDIKEYNW